MDLARAEGSVSRPVDVKNISPIDRFMHPVLGGKVYANPALSSHLAQNIAGKKTDGPAIERLSDRELEIVQLIGEDMSIADISKRRGISKNGENPSGQCPPEA